MSKKICIYGGSSSRVDSRFPDAAFELGYALGERGFEIVCGGGSCGMMGGVARGALKANGTVKGVLPHFMLDLDWHYKELSEIIAVDTMHERKALMIQDSLAVIAMPGGCGTFEELFEAITWKQLGLYRNPVVVFNTHGYFDSFNDLIDNCITREFMSVKHGRLWVEARTTEDVLRIIETSEPVSFDARKFAKL